MANSHAQVFTQPIGSMKNKPFCQSCGMPLNKDPEGGGTEKDGSKSTKYCSLCYKDGHFLSNITDAKEFRDMVQEVMHKNGYSRLVAWLFTRQIPYLKRWKK